MERTGSGHRGCGQGRGGRRPGRGLGECGLLLQASSLLFHTRPMLIIKHGCRSSGARELLAMANVLSAPGPLDQNAHCARPPEDPVGIKARGAWSHTGAKALGRVCSCSGPHPSSSSLPAPLSPDSLPVSPRAHPASERCPSSSPLRMVGVPPPRRAQTSDRNVIIMTR